MKISYIYLVFVAFCLGIGAVPSLHPVVSAFFVVAGVSLAAIFSYASIREQTVANAQYEELRKGLLEIVESSKAKFAELDTRVYAVDKAITKVYNESRGSF